jgi:hypothetical protein
MSGRIFLHGDMEPFWIWRLGLFQGVEKLLSQKVPFLGLERRK